MATKRRLTPGSSSRQPIDQSDRDRSVERVTDRFNDGSDDVDSMPIDHLSSFDNAIYARWIDCSSGSKVLERSVCGAEGAIAIPLAIADVEDKVVTFCALEETLTGDGAARIALVDARNGKQVVKMLKSFLGVFAGKSQAPLWTQRWRIVPGNGYVRWTRRPEDAVFIDGSLARKLRAMSDSICSKIVAKDPFESSLAESSAQT